MLMDVRNSSSRVKTLLLLFLITIFITISSRTHLPVTLCGNPNVPSNLLKFCSTYCSNHFPGIHQISL